jgi:hypothetical protein
METRTVPERGLENAAFRQVSMYDSSNLASPHLSPRRVPFQPTDVALWLESRVNAYFLEPMRPRAD